VRYNQNTLKVRQRLTTRYASRIGLAVEKKEENGIGSRAEKENRQRESVAY
jgi:hypothetical protein